jgi:hypothetical protein
VHEAEKLRGALAKLNTEVRVALLHYAPIRETLDVHAHRVGDFPEQRTPQERVDLRRLRAEIDVRIIADGFAKPYGVGIHRRESRGGEGVERALDVLRADEQVEVLRGPPPAVVLDGQAAAYDVRDPRRPQRGQGRRVRGIGVLIGHPLLRHVRHGIGRFPRPNATRAAQRRPRSSNAETCFTRLPRAAAPAPRSQPAALR